MSEAFDEESTRQESCDVNDYLPEEAVLLEAAKTGVANYAYGITADSIISGSGNDGVQIDIRPSYEAGPTSPLDADLQPIVLTNYARSVGVSAIQSGTSYYCTGDKQASNAIDGDSGTYAIPHKLESIWDFPDQYVFELNLGQLRNIAYVKIMSKSFLECYVDDILAYDFWLEFLDGNRTAVRTINHDGDRAFGGDRAGYFFPPAGTKAQYIRFRGYYGAALAEVMVMGWEDNAFIEKLQEVANAKFKDFAVPNADNEFVRNCFTATDDAVTATACNPFVSSPSSTPLTVVMGDSFSIDISAPRWDNTNNEFRSDLKYDYWDFASLTWKTLDAQTVSLGNIITPAMIRQAIEEALRSSVEVVATPLVESCYENECKLDTKVSSNGHVIIG